MSEPLNDSPRDQDHLLTVKALHKIVSAQKRGTLSLGIHIRRLPTQIVLERLTDADRDWMLKHFPGGEYSQVSYGIKRRKGSSQSYEEAHYVVGLREPLQAPRAEHPSWVPRVEIWGIMRPHECRNFKGVVEPGKDPVWRCGVLSCGKRVTKTKAKALGLNPEKKK
jgi:hypothetical protein